MAAVRVWLCPVHKYQPKRLYDGDDTPRCPQCRLPLEMIEYGPVGPHASKR